MCMQKTACWCLYVKQIANKGLKGLSVQENQISYLTKLCKQEMVKWQFLFI